MIKSSQLSVTFQSSRVKIPSSQVTSASVRFFTTIVRLEVVGDWHKIAKNYFRNTLSAICYAKNKNYLLIGLLNDYFEHVNPFLTPDAIVEVKDLKTRKPADFVFSQKF